MNERWYQAECDRFCAGFAVRDDQIVTTTAPILAWARGRHPSTIRRYLDNRGGTIRRIHG